MIGDPKRITPRDDDYLQYIRERDCVVCGRTPCDPAHSFGQRGERIKSSDYTVIPLCRTHHKEQHRGVHTFAKRHGLNYYEIAFRLYHEYTTGVSV